MDYGNIDNSLLYKTLKGKFGHDDFRSSLQKRAIQEILKGMIITFN